MSEIDNSNNNDDDDDNDDDVDLEKGCKVDQTM